jgi:hypothetical protein
MKVRLAAIALIASLGLSIASTAQAAGVTTRQMHALAARAQAGDAAALAELQAVTQVDGRPAQIAAALGGASTRELSARLAALATGGGAASVSATAAQRTAASILSEPRFGSAPVPDPLSTVFDKLGRWIARLAAGVPGGPAVLWALAAALVLAVAGLGARRMMRRLDPPTQVGISAERAARDDPSWLEREAQAAEARGAFGDAVRLRFRAGLLMLSSRLAIEYRPSLLTTDVARRLRSTQFDALATSFERIAYGDAAAGAADAAAAREGWKRLRGTEPKR